MCFFTFEKPHIGSMSSTLRCYLAVVDSRRLSQRISRYRLPIPTSAPRRLNDSIARLRTAPHARCRRASGGPLTCAALPPVCRVNTAGLTLERSKNFARNYQTVVASYRAGTPGVSMGAVTRVARKFHPKSENTREEFPRNRFLVKPRFRVLVVGSERPLLGTTARDRNLPKGRRMRVRATHPLNQYWGRKSPT